MDEAEKKAMQEAADVALLELEGMMTDGVLDIDAATILATWWQKHFPNAGHKKLARGFMERCAPKNNKDIDELAALVG